MKTATSIRGVLAGFLLFTLTAPPATASFSSLYCFGDGVCTTTRNESKVPELYHGNRYCNGRVWVEILAQWQGLPYDPAKNKSFFGHDSVALVTKTAAFSAPDAATALVIVWSANADMVGFLNNPSLTLNESGIPAWTAEINQAIARHVQAVTNLYDAGARTLIMPNAADITETPAYFYLPERPFVRERAAQYNAAFATAMAALPETLPGLVIHRPDIFGFFDQVISNPAAFGMVNPPGEPATLALTEPYQLDGPEADYVFWDYWHPTAKFQMHLADFVQHMVSPFRIDGVTVADGEAQLHIVNIPLGREGCVESISSPQGTWQEQTTIFEPAGSGSTSATVPSPAGGSSRFYRARFPVVWTWP